MVLLPTCQVRWPSCDRTVAVDTSTTSTTVGAWLPSRATTCSTTLPVYAADAIHSFSQSSRPYPSPDGSSSHAGFTAGR